MVKLMHRFDDSKAQIKQDQSGFVASCECGWRSEAVETREEAIIAFENHVASDPKHRMVEEKGGKNLFSLFLATLGFIYIISPIDIVPDYLVGVGWIEDILIGILCIVFVKKGLDDKSPAEILGEIFG